MTTYSAGTRVMRGYYFSAKSWTLENVASDGQMLPGTADEKYVAIPVLAALVVAPLMGAMFLMFLPFVGFALTAKAVVAPIARMFKRSATEVAATLQPGWAPGAAHLTGRAGEEEEKAAEGQAPAAPEHLSKLEGEIAERRSSK